MIRNHIKNINIQWVVHNAFVNAIFRLLRKQNYVPINGFTVVLAFLVWCFIVMTVGYAYTTTTLQERAYNISSLQNKIKAARATSVELQITLSEGRDLPRILDRSSSLLYTEIEQVRYIERPNSSPFRDLNE